ncbi:trimethylamine methyltransferase family protein [Cloacibacillus porcorum]|uniref:trimethylamine methyltransferase family protein n=1 Tax=Cloacibacillus porcorum TaxID=1197717 RepID=UPI0023EF83AE|nr:trimethylamine methyltransferase family protein [Cloacibacillus porcorum]MDD7649515.1 trimethylamine methyltransferase family protein [Cloacibacillus porcorum]MDY4094516.1 trimethylamine methyltransferase family protein [Cloacibacillus porcorum]
MGTFKLLSDADLLRIDQASRALLWEVGVEVHDERAMDYYEGAGAHVDREKCMVRVPDYVITDTLKKCSSSVRLYNRKDPEPLVIGGDDVYFGTVGIATNVLDINTDQYRSVLTQDLVDIIQLSDVLERPHYILVPATPTDVPSAVVDLVETKALLMNTSKHFITEAQNAENCRRAIEMAALVAGGLDKLAAKPFMTMLVTLTSPLHFRQDVADLIIETAKVGLPLFIESGPMAGGTGPATMAGNLICANAEILNAFVLAKAVNPEVPLVYASWARLLDMRAATCSHGGPEFAMLRVGTSQLAKYYGLPCGGGSVLADTKSIDVQLGMEKMGTGLLPALAGTNMCTGMGLFADENAISLETLVIDWEITGWIERVLRGIEVTKETCDLAVFKEVGPGGDFVRCAHTRENYKRESFLPHIMDRGYLALDKDPLAKEMRKRAKSMYPKLMREYKAPEISADIVRQMDEIIAR